MVLVNKIQVLRPKLADEFDPGEFIPRTEAIAAAYRWGKEIHAGQLRMSGEPYFETHCVWVASFLDHLIGNEAWTIAGLLHDVVEDQNGNFDQIRKKFPGPLGEEIAHIVDGVTKMSTPRDGRSRELETLRKIAMFRDPAVFLVKLADKTHNLSTLQHMSAEKQVAKATEAIRAYAKLAGILNCYRWRRWIEDISFPYAEPEVYRNVREIIDRDPRLSIEFINGFMDRLSTVMDDAGVNGEINITVNGYWQSWQKLRRMARMRTGSMSSFESLNDLISFRMIVDEADIDGCYRLLARVNRFLGPYLDHNRFDDYIACPQNGYRALQVTAWIPEYGAIETAIATRDMEGENVWGIVYKLQKGKDISEYKPIEVFTPTGGARFLPEGSTVLDAVASIQQEFLLDKISAVEVNGNLVHLSDQVNPGDVIEVITGGRRIRPISAWLQFANNSTARLLRAVLATEALKTAAETGREQIKNILSERGILALEDVLALESHRIDLLLETLGGASLEDLYAAVGGGAIQLSDLSAALDEIGISKARLNWTTINIMAGHASNQPGVLARLAGLISNAGGNILRSVNDTTSDGGFALRLVVQGLSTQQAEMIQDAYWASGFIFDLFEIV